MPVAQVGDYKVLCCDGEGERERRKKKDLPDQHKMLSDVVHTHSAVNGTYFCYQLF